MAYPNVYTRYEQKYLITAQQKELLLVAMSPRMVLDPHDCTTIRDLYFDTEDYQLIRHSIQKPTHRETLRMRSYQRAMADSTVFVELKKRQPYVVHKWCIPLPEHIAMEWMDGGGCYRRTCVSQQIEIYCDQHPTLRPSIFLCYNHEAYHLWNTTDLCITFDDAILHRQTDLSLRSEAYGMPILPEGTTLMEIKCSGAVPSWLTDILSCEHISKIAFSKYAAVYQQFICPQIEGIVKCEA